MKKLLLPLLAITPLWMFAGGFQVNLQGTKQTGMGHLGTSFYLGASSAYFNPAMMGLSKNRINIEAGASAIFGTVGYQNQQNGMVYFTDNPTGTPFYLYGTFMIDSNFTAGLAIYTPFGNRVDWGDDWAGRYLVQNISLSAIYIQPTLSYKITDKLSFGAGLTYVIGSVEINRAIDAGVTNNNSVRLEGDATGIGFNAGIHYQASEKIRVGLTHRSEVEIDLEDGEVDFMVDPLLESSLPDGQFSSMLPLPATTSLGITYEASENLVISVEGNFVAWSDYESLDFDFENNTEELKDSENPRNYKDELIVRIGGQYTLWDELHVRLGAYYDPSPVRDDYFTPETPSTDNIGLTSGLSYDIAEHFTLDASFLYIHGQERTSYYSPENFGGKYKSRTFVPGLGLNFKF